MKRMLVQKLSHGMRKQQVFRLRIPMIRAPLEHSRIDEGASDARSQESRL